MLSPGCSPTTGQASEAHHAPSIHGPTVSPENGSGKRFPSRCRTTCERPSVPRLPIGPRPRGGSPSVLEDGARPAHLPWRVGCRSRTNQQQQHPARGPQWEAASQSNGRRSPLPDTPYQSIGGDLDHGQPVAVTVTREAMPEAPCPAHVVTLADALRPQRASQRRTVATFAAPRRTRPTRTTRRATSRRRASATRRAAARTSASRDDGGSEPGPCSPALPAWVERSAKAVAR